MAGSHRVKRERGFRLSIVITELFMACPGCLHKRSPKMNIKTVLTILTVVSGISNFTSLAYSQPSREEIEKNMRLVMPASAKCTRDQYGPAWDGSACVDSTSGFEIIFERGDYMHSGQDDILNVIFPASSYNLSPQQEGALASLFTNFGFPESDVEKCITSRGGQQPKQEQEIQGNKIRFICGRGGRMIIVRSDRF
jgi:hypothetical protein